MATEEIENWESTLLNAARRANGLTNVKAMQFFYSLLEFYKKHRRLTEKQIEAFHKFWSKIK